ncbi:hypothetical protein DR81_1442 [Francisella tularensis]|nr:hypothetical protein DR81_1442 [Francisella tularensis]
MGSIKKIKKFAKKMKKIKKGVAFCEEDAYYMSSPADG